MTVSEKMKFVLKSSSNSGRLGILLNMARLQDFEMETPHAFLCTSGCTIPHLTHEVLQMVSKSNLGLSIPIQSVTPMQEQMELYKHTIADYIGMKEYVTYCSYINFVENKKVNTFINGKVRVKTRNGNQFFSCKSYMKFIELLKPDMFLLLSDGATNLQSSKKQMQRSFNNSLNLFEKCMEIYNKSDTLKSSLALAAVQGGLDLSLREQFSKLLGESSLFGVVIDGLHDCDETVMDISTNEIKASVKASLKYIPEDKLRIIHGCWNPNVVLDLVELGIDLFDSSYPTYITERSGALIFPNTESLLEKFHCNGTANGEADIKQEEPLSKKLKLTTKSKFFILMSDPCYTTDFTPIDKNCTCLACKYHTRAYIHHLVSANEMLGPVLLMMHNLHHYLLFFSTIRELLKCGRFQEFKKSFQKWLDGIKDKSLPA